MKLDPDFTTRVHGIPCGVVIGEVTPGHPGTRDRFAQGMLAEPGTPPEPSEAEFQLTDRKGYRARWLENLMDHDEGLAIELECLDHLKKRSEPEY